MQKEKLIRLLYGFAQEYGLWSASLSKSFSVFVRFVSDKGFLVNLICPVKDVKLPTP